MKLAKSLLLGSAAGFVAVSGANAADIPARGAAPVAPAVEYVRVCSTYGVGFFFIPGTDTCLRISGRVRAEARYFDTFTRADDAIGWRARARLNFDARTATSYGVLRTFIRYELTRNGGNYGAQGQGISAPNFSAANFTVTGALPVTVDLNKAFIQFAGITAGRATSFFDFYANDLNWGGLPTGSDTYGADPVVFAYTASFGAGFSATISAEDPSARRLNVAPLAGSLVVPGFGTTNDNIAFAYAGQSVPEIVGALRYDGAFGSFQLSGALHEVKSLNLVNPTFVAPTLGTPPTVIGGVVIPGTPGNPGNPGFAFTPDTEYGFAVQAGAKFNLPFLAAGDVLWLQAAYTQGALNYIGIGSRFGQGNLITSNVDAVVTPFGDIKMTDAFVLTAAFLHYWTPQFRQAVFGTYGEIDYGASVTTAVDPLFGARPSGALVDQTFWQIGTNLIYSPVRDLDIGVEVVYRNVDPKGRVFEQASNIPGATFTRTRSHEDAIEGRFRIQRDF